MTLPRFAFTSRATPFLEIGVGDSRVPTGQAVWDVARWDASTSKWAGSEPTWLDYTCDAFAFEWEYGRPRTTDRFVPGTMTVEVNNATGWADPSADIDPASLSMRPGRAIRIGVQHQTLGKVVLFRGFIDALRPTYSPSDPDHVTITAIDALGEVNRAKFAGSDVEVGAGEGVSARILRILSLAQWPIGKAAIDDAYTPLVGDMLNGQAADLLGRAADSIGGVIFGDQVGNVTFHSRDWQTFPATYPPDGTIGNVQTTPVPAAPGYLTPTVGTVSTPDPGPLPAQCTFVFKVRGPAGSYGVVVGHWPGAPELAWNVALAPGDDVVYFMTSADGSTVTYDFAVTPDPTGADQYRAVSVDIGHPITEWSSSGDGVWHPIGTGLGTSVTPFDTAQAMGIGNAFDGRIYSVELRTGLDPTGGAVVWRFDADDYPGTGMSYVDPRGRTWTLAGAGAITPKVAAVPADACPIEWVRPFDRADIATRAIMGRDVETAVVVDDAEGQVVYGIEPFERTDLWTQEASDLTLLAERALRVRAWDTAPIVRGVSLDARIGDAVLDVMTEADPYRPTRYRCRLLYDRGLVFDGEYLTTAVVHRMAPGIWEMQMQLDTAAPYAAVGGRWDVDGWDRATWAIAV